MSPHIALLAAAVLGTGAMAAEPDWKAQLAGLDGIAVVCTSSTELAIAQTVCEKVADAVQSTAGDVGTFFKHFGYLRESDADPDVPVGRVLILRVFLRGTTDPYAVYAATRASVSYAGAVEAGTESPARAGELVLFERATLGSGTPSQLDTALPGAVIGRMQPLLDAIRAHWGA